MDKNKQPGIIMRAIDLVSCKYDLNPDYDTTKSLPRPKLKLTGWQSNKVDGNEKENDTLLSMAAFELDFDNDVKPLEFECNFVAFYEKENESAMSFDEFKPAIQIAHIVSYLREFISNLTVRTPNQRVIYLPPVNTHVLYKEYQERLKQQQIEVDVEE